MGLNVVFAQHPQIGIDVHAFYIFDMPLAFAITTFTLSKAEEKKTPTERVYLLNFIANEKLQTHSHRY